MDSLTITLIALFVFSIVGFFWGAKTARRSIRYISLMVSVSIIGFYFANCIAGPGQFQDIFLKIGKISGNIPYYVRVSLLLLSTLVLGALFCGWICPMGSIQEFLYRKSIGIKVPARLDSILRYLRFVVLALLIIVPLFVTGKKICGLNPFRVAFNLSGSVYLVAAFAFIAIASLFIYRPWCRYLCPYGALLSLLSKISFWKIKVDTEKCTLCRKCVSNCPMQAISIKDYPYISDEKCIKCLECVVGCSKNALKLKPLFGGHAK